MIRVVLFDLDGTLLDRAQSLAAFVAAQHEQTLALHTIPKGTYVSRFIELDARGHVWKDRVYQTLVGEFGIVSCRWEELLRDYEENFARACIGFPHLHATLRALRTQGYRLGVVTNGREAFQMRVIRALAIQAYFDTVLISEAEGIRKPDPEIFHRALRRLGARPEESVFVGDHPEADIAGARRAGLRTIWKRDLAWGEPTRYDAAVNGLDELPAVLDWLRASAQQCASADEGRP
ncbi:MAG: HAD family hydrolase [Gemmatimonadota bacterium]|nr:HAD family hydrolase [Gemmatimonadota bacterium]